MTRTVLYAMLAMAVSLGAAEIGESVDLVARRELQQRQYSLGIDVDSAHVRFVRSAILERSIIDKEKIAKVVSVLMDETAARALNTGINGVKDIAKSDPTLEYVIKLDGSELARFYKLGVQYALLSPVDDKTIMADNGYKDMTGPGELYMSFIRFGNGVYSFILTREKSGKIFKLLWF